jgi:hypothetical protein
MGEPQGSQWRIAQCLHYNCSAYRPGGIIFGMPAVNFATHTVNVRAGKLSCSRETVSDRFWMGCLFWGVAAALGLTMLCCSKTPEHDGLTSRGVSALHLSLPSDPFSIP